MTFSGVIALKYDASAVISNCDVFRIDLPQEFYLNAMSS